LEVLVLMLSIFFTAACFLRGQFQSSLRDRDGIPGSW
jgi:hypothetical protein